MNDSEQILIETQARSKSNQKRIDGLEEEIKEIKSEQKAIYEIASSIKLLVHRVDTISDKVDETSKKIDNQSEQWRISEAKLSERISEASAERDHKTAEGVSKVQIAVITATCSAIASAIISYFF